MRRLLPLLLLLPLLPACGPSSTTVDDGDDDDDSVNADLDGDGFTTEEGDCDDSDATVYPGAPELDDGVDNDCDGFEDERQDSDGDTISDADESDGDTDGDGTPDYLDLDSDGDGRSDADEAGDTSLETPPLDTDGDGAADAHDADGDGDALNDVDDPDPTDPDSDDDGFIDGLEALAGSDPEDASSQPDAIVVELPEGERTELEFEVCAGCSEVDVAFLVDTTWSMDLVLTALNADLPAFFSEMERSFGRTRYALATFDDYDYHVLGQNPDLPFRLNQQLTSDRDAVAGAFAPLTVHNGSDGPESGIEALFQLWTGQGYDQECDGALSSSDVPPFIARPDDAFGGAVPGVHDPSTPDTGRLGGAGFDGPAVTVMITDDILRDPEDQMPVPPGCTPAGGSQALEAGSALGMHFIGVDTGDWDQARPQLEELASSLGSELDLDGDGTVEPVVFSELPDPAVLVDTIRALAPAGEPSPLYQAGADDAAGLVYNIFPTQYLSPAAGDVLDFTVELQARVSAGADAQVFGLTFSVVDAAGTTVLSVPIWVVVPAA